MANYYAEGGGGGSTSSDLIARSKAGNADAFNLLTEPYRPELRRFCERLLGDVQQAEQAIADTLKFAFDRLPSFQEDYSFASWLFACAKYNCLLAAPQTNTSALFDLFQMYLFSTTTGWVFSIPWIRDQGRHIEYLYDIVLAKVVRDNVPCSNKVFLMFALSFRLPWWVELNNFISRGPETKGYFNSAIANLRSHKDFNRVLEATYDALLAAMREETSFPDSELAHWLSHPPGGTRDCLSLHELPALSGELIAILGFTEDYNSNDTEEPSPQLLHACTCAYCWSRFVDVCRSNALFHAHEETFSVSSGKAAMAVDAAPDEDSEIGAIPFYSPPDEEIEFPLVVISEPMPEPEPEAAPEWHWNEQTMSYQPPALPVGEEEKEEAYPTLPAEPESEPEPHPRATEKLNVENKYLYLDAPLIRLNSPKTQPFKDLFEKMIGETTDVAQENAEAIEADAGVGVINAGSNTIIIDDGEITGTEIAIEEDAQSSVAEEYTRRYTDIRFAPRSVVGKQETLTVRISLLPAPITDSAYVQPVLLNRKWFRRKVLLSIVVSGPAFAIAPRCQQLEVPRDRDSAVLTFLVTPLQTGKQSLDVELFRGADRIGYVVVTTRVSEDA